MYNREGQPRDYEERDRRAWRLNIVIFVVLLLILIGVDVCMIIVEEAAKEIALGIVCTLIWGVLTGLVIAHYVKKYVSPRVNDTETDQRKAAMYFRKDGEDMFEVCERYRKNFRTNSIMIMAVLAVLVVAVICLNPQTSVLGISIPPSVMAVFYILLLVFIGGVAVKANRKFRSADDLRKELYIHGFDPDKVNRDFMHGSTHRLPSGFLVIGQDYYVVYSKNEVHVCAINDIKEVKGVTNTEEAKPGKLSGYRWHIVHVIEQKGLYSFGCSNDLSIETIVDEFRKKGLVTSYNILKEDKVKGNSEE